MVTELLLRDNLYIGGSVPLFDDTLLCTNFFFFIEVMALFYAT